MKGLPSSPRAKTSPATCFDVRGSPLLGLCVAACAGLTPPPPIDAAVSLAAAETAFAAHSVREGMRAAFISHFAHDGVFIRDGWTGARAYLEPRPDPPIVLEWRPVYVLAATSGELGLSTGPWKLTSKTKPDATPGYGQFISVWRRDGNDPWKVVADLGLPHPAPDLWDRPLEARSVAASAAVTDGDLDAAERSFAEEARGSGLRAAYSSHASDTLRLYRNGNAPGVGKQQAIALVEEVARPITWTIE